MRKNSWERPSPAGTVVSLFVFILEANHSSSPACGFLSRGEMTLMRRCEVPRTIAAFCLVPVLFWLLSCASNPASGKKELMLVDEKDEIKLGRDTDVRIVREYGVYDDPALAAYLGEMCRRLGQLSHRPHLAYHFKTLDTSVVNAFAVPGGYVYFTRGILAALNSEAELGGVMGHEIGHITARHTAQQISRAQLAQMGLILPGLLGIPGLSELAQIGVGLLFLRFSRDNEREADALGVAYATKAGYDASQMASFFETLQRMDPKPDRSGLPGWFSTHPSPDDREEAVRALARKLQRQRGLKEPKINREEYLKRLDGLIYGEDPRQGYVAEGVFFHPALRFQFPVPAGWKVNHTTSAVQLVSKERDAMILFSLSTKASIREALQAFVAGSKASVQRSDPLEVGSFAAHRVVSDLILEKGTVRALSYFIQKEKQVCVFHGLASVNDFRRHQELYDHTMRQFRELTDAKRIEVQPDRVRVRATLGAETLEHALRALGVPEAKIKETATLNGGTLKEAVPPSTLLKVVEKGR